MAKGAYVGVQGITPDLRPSIQSAIDNERANRQEKFQKEQYEYQKQQNEIAKQQRDRELDIKERELVATNTGVRADAQRRQAWYTEFGKLLREAQSDISGLPAFSQYLAETFDELANLREAAMYADTLDAVKYQTQAEKLYQSVLQASKLAKDYSTLIPNEYTANTVFTTDKVGDLGIMDYLNQYTSKDFKFVHDSNDNRYVTNGAVNFGHDADGNFVITMKDKTFSSADAAKQHLDSFIVQPDAEGLKQFNAKLNNIKPSKKTYVDAQKGKISKTDIEGYDTMLDSGINQSLLGAYSDDYTYEQAINDKDATLIAVFQDYGVQDNVDNIKELKRVIKKSKMDTVDMSETIIEAPLKEPTPLNRNINYSDSKAVEAEIRRLSNSDNQNDKDAAIRLQNIYSVGKAINDLLTQDNKSPLQALKYNVSKNEDNQYVITSETNYRVTEGTGSSGKTTGLTYSQGESIIIDPTDPNSISLGVRSILKDQYKDADKWATDINTIFDFEHYNNATNEFVQLGKSFEKQSNLSDKTKSIESAIKKYLPEGYKVSFNANTDWFNNDVTVVITDAKNKSHAFKFNTKADKSADNHLSKIIKEIIDMYPRYDGIFRQSDNSQQSSYQPSDNPSGFGNTGNADSNDY